MQNILIKLLMILSLSFVMEDTFGQDLDSNFQYEVRRVYPYIFITKDELKEAKSLSDINVNYKKSWVRKFLSVDVITFHNGEKTKTSSKTDILTLEQKTKMITADAGSEISVKVVYIPDNSLFHNEPKEFNFSFIVEPEKIATFVGGKEKLMEYLKKNAIDKISKDSFVGYDLSMIKFTINEYGEITNVSIFNDAYQESRSKKINDRLVKTIQNMPCWKPAEYANGTNVKQDFVFNVGNMYNCSIFTLKLWKDSLDEVSIRN